MQIVLWTVTKLDYYHRAFTQEYGIDYEETFAPITLLTFVRNLLAITMVKQQSLFYMNVKNELLNDDLTK